MTLLTEEEAAEKWCPMGRIVSGKRTPEDGVKMFAGSEPANMAAVGDSHGDLIPLGRCIGSRCMAWRVANSGYERNGYCGAFGKVEP